MGSKELRRDIVARATRERDNGRRGQRPPGAPVYTFRFAKLLKFVQDEGDGTQVMLVTRKRGGIKVRAALYPDRAIDMEVIVQDKKLLPARVTVVLGQGLNTKAIEDDVENRNASITLEPSDIGGCGQAQIYVH